MEIEEQRQHQPDRAAAGDRDRNVLYFNVRHEVQPKAHSCRIGRPGAVRSLK